MKKRGIYIAIIVVYIFNSVEYIMGRLYALGENVFGKKLLPDFIWDYCNSAYYKEAGGIRFVISCVIFIILAVVFFILFKKHVSKATTGLFCTTVITPLLYVASALTDNGVFIAVMFAVSVAHIVLTIIFSAKALVRK